jgi:nicotinate-nucleotide--dimethylbenzimidazole phosphoribosyltransferase
MPRTAAYSVCLAIENLWLAARVEGVGVGWVSILDPDAVSRILKLPPEIELIAYLCVGYPIQFRSKPMLEEVGWKNREQLQPFVFTNRWGNPRKLTEGRVPLLEQPLPKPDTAITQAAQLKIDRKTKPLGSLGVLEKVAVRLASLKQTLEPRLTQKRICIFAGTHGVTAEGVSAYPGEVTGQMVLNFLAGGAAINVLARHAGIDLYIIDTGVDMFWPQEIANRPNFFMRSIRRGTRNFRNEPAMSPLECRQAIDIGREQAQKAHEQGVDVLGIGEMGIGNTTAASCLLAMLCGFSPAEAVGRGTGVTDAVLARKVDVVSRAIERHAAAAAGLLYSASHSEATAEELGFYWLQVVGGFEIAAMTGAILAAAEMCSNGTAPGTPTLPSPPYKPNRPKPATSESPKLTGTTGSWVLKKNRCMANPFVRRSTLRGAALRWGSTFSRPRSCWMSCGPMPPIPTLHTTSARM